MGIDSFSPQIKMLCKKIETTWGKTPRVHSDFTELAETIQSSLRKYISDTTLERVWGYSNRGYKTVSRHTLDLLSEYAGFETWHNFCKSLVEEGIKDSDMVDDGVIFSDELDIDDRLELKWLPNRECIVRYLGNNKFVAEKCLNSTIQPGDTFCCIEFRLNQPAMMDKFIAARDESVVPKRYIAGLKHGISHIKKL